MKRIKTIAILSVVIIGGLVACNGKRSPGRVYMPDMHYSRAYEANMPNILNDSGIHYIPTPVPGTMRRGEVFAYGLPNDSTGYEMSGSIRIRLDSLILTLCLKPRGYIISTAEFAMVQIWTRKVRWQFQVK